MTQQEKKIKQYVNAVERRLRLPLKLKARINGDLGTDIHARLEEGKDIDTVLAELGTPDEVAGGFNEALAEFRTPRGSVWRWLFAVMGVLAALWALGGLLSLAPPVWRLLTGSASLGTIGGADGPTEIYVTNLPAVFPGTPGLAAVWFALPLALGCAAAFLLLKYNSGGHSRRQRWAQALSAAALALWGVLALLFLVFLGVFSPHSGAPARLFSWTSAFQLLNLLLLPSFWLPVVTLCVAARRCRRLKQATPCDGPDEKPQ